MYKMINHTSGEIYKSSTWCNSMELILADAMRRKCKVTCEWVEEEREPTMCKVHFTCPCCHKQYTVEYPIDGLTAWENGELIQTAMPNVSSKDRECLTSGLCHKCQKEIFG